MSWFNLDNLRKTSVYITPNFPTLQTKRYKFQLFKLFFYLTVYTLAIIILVTGIITFSPARKILMIFEKEQLKEQTEQLEQLQQKVILLTRELSELSSINKRLKYAITLASTDSLDSTAAIYDSLRTYSDDKKNRPDGAIYSVFKDFIEKYFNPEADSTELSFFTPTSGVIVKNFIPGEGHLGADYAVPVGTPVYASESGIILFADYTLNYGYSIIIRHNSGFSTHYKHCEELLKHERDVVKKGELIALSGNTGTLTTGPHLHFEIWKNDNPLDPVKLLIRN